MTLAEMERKLTEILDKLNDLDEKMKRSDEMFENLKRKIDDES